MKIRNPKTNQIIEVPVEKESAVRYAIKNGMDPLLILNDGGTRLNKYQGAGISKEPEKKQSNRNLINSLMQAEQFKNSKSFASESTGVKTQAAAQKFNKDIIEDINTMSDMDFHDKYNTSKHRYKYDHDAKYRAITNQEIAKAQAQGTPMLKEQVMINPNNMFMVPGTGYTPESSQELIGSNLNVIGAFLPIPGIQAVGEIPSLFTAIGDATKGLAKIPKKPIISPNVSERNVYNLGSDTDYERYLINSNQRSATPVTQRVVSDLPPPPIETHPIFDVDYSSPEYRDLINRNLEHYNLLRERKAREILADYHGTHPINIDPNDVRDYLSVPSNPGVLPPASFYTTENNINVTAADIYNNIPIHIRRQLEELANPKSFKQLTYEQIRIKNPSLAEKLKVYFDKAATNIKENLKNFNVNAGKSVDSYLHPKPEFNSLINEVNDKLEQGVGVKKGDHKIELVPVGNSMVEVVVNGESTGSMTLRPTTVDRTLTDILLNKPFQRKQFVNAKFPGLRRTGDFPFKHKEEFKTAYEKQGISGEISKALSEVLKSKGQRLYSGATGHTLEGGNRYLNLLNKGVVEVVDPVNEIYMYKKRGGTTWLDQYQDAGTTFKEPNQYNVALPDATSVNKQILVSDLEPITPPIGITNDLLLKQAYKESTFNPNAGSGAGAIGLAQIKSDALADYVKRTGNKKVNLKNIKDAKTVQEWLMNNLYNADFINKPNQSDTVRLAKTLGAYNWGRGSMFNMLSKLKNEGYDIYNSTDWVERLPEETKDYINKILLSKNKDFEDEYSAALKNAKYKEILDIYGYKPPIFEVLSNDSSSAVKKQGGTLYKYDLGGTNVWDEFEREKQRRNKLIVGDTTQEVENQPKPAVENSVPQAVNKVTMEDIMFKKPPFVQSGWLSDYEEKPKVTEVKTEIPKQVVRKTEIVQEPKKTEVVQIKPVKRVPSTPIVNEEESDSFGNKLIRTIVPSVVGSLSTINDIGDAIESSTDYVEKNVESLPEIASRAWVKYGYGDSAKDRTRVIKNTVVPVKKVVPKEDPNKLKITPFYKELNRTPEGYISYINVFDNDKGFDYIPTARIDKDATYNNVQGIAHFLYDFDLTTETAADNSATANLQKSIKYNPDGSINIDSLKSRPANNPGSTIQNPYYTVYKKNPNGTVNIKYKKADEIKKGDKIGDELRQYRFTDINWDSSIHAPDFNNTISALETYDKKPTYFIYAKGLGKDAYGKYGGGSVTFLIDGKNLAIDFAGSLNQIRSQAQTLIKDYNIKPQDLIIAYHDLGSYSAKPGSDNGKLSNRRWYAFNTNKQTGAGLAIPRL